MSEQQGTPPGTIPQAPELTLTAPEVAASPNHSSVSAPVDINRMPFSPEMMEANKEVIQRYQKEDGTYDMDSLLSSFVEQRKLISSGAHKKAPDAAPEEAPNVGDDPSEAVLSGSPPPEAATSIPVTEGENSEGSLSFAELDAIVASTGDVTEEQLARYNGDKEVVQEALAARAKARADAADIKIQLVESLVGGQGEYASLVQWASENLSADDINTYNEAYASGDARRLELELKDLVSKRTAIDGSYGRHVTGVPSAGTSDGDVFANQAEYTQYVKANAANIQRDKKLDGALQAKLLRSINAGKL